MKTRYQTDTEKNNMICAEPVFHHFQAGLKLDLFVTAFRSTILAMVSQNRDMVWN